MTLLQLWLTQRMGKCVRKCVTFEGFPLVMSQGRYLATMLYVRRFYLNDTLVLDRLAENLRSGRQISDLRKFQTKASKVFAEPICVV
jgi:hypothetical protein